MFTFSKPRYQSKRPHPLTQKPEASYQFDVTHTGSSHPSNFSPVSFLLPCNTPLTVQQIEEALSSEQEWWTMFLQSFLTATASYFTRTYTVQHLQRILRHLLSSPAPSPASSPVSSTSDVSLSYPEPQHICCVPCILELIGGQLLVYWSYQSVPARIDIPDELPVLPSQKGEMEEWDLELVPEQSNATEVLPSPERLLDKQRVREARLKAKLAVYRAQYQMNRYYDKYGDEISESEESEESEDDDA
jgi:hypothetical protein